MDGLAEQLVVGGRHRRVQVDDAGDAAAAIDVHGVVRIGRVARDVLGRRVKHEVERAGLQLDGRGRAIAHDADVELVEQGGAATPVVLVARKEEVIADFVLGQVEGAGADPLRGVGLFVEGIGIADVE